MSQRLIFHVDMDAFFASIEQRDDPSIRNKPVVVGALPGSRGVVSAASYEARRFGIHSAMPINQAYARCPKATFIHPRMGVYSSESKKIMAILGRFSPCIEPISVDEAFIDITGTEKLWGATEQTAEKISAAIRHELHLTCSIGVAPNKFLAKLASDVNKPDGITITPFEKKEIVHWLAPMDVSRIWGVGKKTQQILSQWGIVTIADLQKLSEEELQMRFGKHGAGLYYLARGIDYREVGTLEEVKSISREHTFERDSSNPQEWKQVLLSLSRNVGYRARRKGLKGRTVVLTYRTPDFQRHSRRVTLPTPTNTAKTIFDAAKKILSSLTSTTPTLRLIGVGITNFGQPVQTDLFISDERKNAWLKSEEAIDTVIDKFGKNAVFLGGEKIKTSDRMKKNHQ
ncbi:MAG: DNA polymerase IV [Fibrobacterota bacterium]